MSDLRFPIGKFVPPDSSDATQRARLIADIDSAPAALRRAAQGLSNDQIDTPYRPGGWTVRQVVHHLPDSHMNAYIRFKLALTENEPAIKTYEENLWANLPDTQATPLDTSLILLETLHKRWSILLREMQDADFARTFKHPDRGAVSLDWTLALYSWHGRHHVAHITALRERMEWA
ncbi:MAG: putative metal-dependent hydrolase [Gemmatimonadaceae bacterium]|nr:putative metal-dependent hydrolase [Gemmatimonadaceae bacterium]MDQ3517288.1 putative metal-dependent hydrolase [Gemmatimonadota bacterium]